MQSVAKIADLETPTHVVQCSGSREHAYVISLNSKQYWKRSWFNANGEEDEDKIQKINDMLPDCTELTACFTGKLNRKLAEYYLGPKIVGFEDQVVLDIPDAIFLQRVSARTKTFDMVMFYGTKPTIISVVDKADLDTIRNWYPHKIYSCGADPLPLKDMETWMETNKGDTMYTEIYDRLFNQEESSCSEYEPESDPESEDESCDESEEEPEQVSESEESDVEESDGDYEPEEKDKDEDDEEYDEPPCKKIKVSE